MRAPVLRPSFSTAFDYEGELAVVIGRGGRHISEQDVGAHIAGYSCYNDVSVRDWQRHTAQWTPGQELPKHGCFRSRHWSRRMRSRISALLL